MGCDQLHEEPRAAVERGHCRAILCRRFEQARGHELLIDEHFTVDGTLLEAAASLKSFKPQAEPDEPPADDPDNPTVNFLDLHLRDSGLQPGKNEEAGDGVGSSVPGGAKK